MERKPVHETHLLCQGEQYTVAVFELGMGRFVAATQIEEGDVIEVDGTTLEEALERHRALLPLALQSRALCGPRH